jgi:fructose transport system substrate-binding protein
MEPVVRSRIPKPVAATRRTQRTVRDQMANATWEVEMAGCHLSPRPADYWAMNTTLPVPTLRTALSLAFLCAVPLVACSKRADDVPIIGIVTKTETNPFFVKMKEGAEQAAAANGVKLLTGGGRSDGDNAGQVAAIENQIAAGAKVILISPSDAKAIVPTITRVRESGVLVIALDSPTDPMEATDGFFGTDNYRAGELIGAYAKARLGDKAAKVVTIDLIPGHPTGAQRHNGFLKGMGLASNERTSNENAAPPEVVCTGDSVGDQAKAQTVMENCLQSAPTVNVVYAINEPSAAGAYNALRKAGRDKDVILVTVDGGCRGVADVAEGHFAATAQQYPLRMAELGVQAAMEFFKSGKKPSGFVDTGVALVAGEPVAGVESLSAGEAATRCWGTK